MSKPVLLSNANIINEGISFFGSILIRNGLIDDIIEGQLPDSLDIEEFEVHDLDGKYLIPGVIDDQVHFREPGLTHKGDIYTESKAAIAGGITSYMEMPNTFPGTLTQELLEEKYQIAAEKSLANYSFYMGVSNLNLEEVLKTNPRNVCGIKIFLGASTGNMLVDNALVLEEIFSKSKMLIAVHCEKESIIQRNIAFYKEQYGVDISPEFHPLIRSREACFTSSKKAVELAQKHGTRLHLFHLSTSDEMGLLDNCLPLEQKKITAEVCVHHLWFDEKDYLTKGNLIKWNPAIKTSEDRKALMEALLNNKIDVIASDHAPHALEEKLKPYFEAPSGGPLVQHTLLAMLELYKNGKLSLEKIVEKMCHAPAVCFKVEKRGFIRKGYKADLCVLNLQGETQVTKDSLLYKCAWSPFEGVTFHSKITHTFVNGNLVYCMGQFNEAITGERLLFRV